MRAIKMVLSATLMSAAAFAVADTYTSIDVPGAISTDPSGINSSGEIVGTYTDASNIVHGFRLDHGVLATIDYPGATNTTEISINTRGDVAGFFLDSASQWHDLHR